MFICWGGAKPPFQTPPPFVMTQINEIKRNRLPNFFYAFPMSTANLHSSRIKEWCDKWLLKLNISKCKTVSYCMKNTWIQSTL